MAAPIPDAVEYLWDKLHEMEPATVLGGIYAFKPGYHATRTDNKNNWPGNYSITDSQDQGGPSNMAAALDWTFPDAQQADYDKIIKYSKRLLDCGKDPDDDRLDWMREFYGQADKDTAVEGWDFRYARSASSDPSHLWHIHFSFSRNALTVENMDKLLVVLRGDDVATGIIGLKKGMSGAEVDGLQNVLRRAGYDPGDSGTYDSKTSAAVLACRRDMGSNISSGDEVSGDGWAQIMSALAIAYAKQFAGKDGKDGKDGLNAGTTVTITGTGVVESPQG